MSQVSIRKETGQSKDSIETQTGRGGQKWLKNEMDDKDGKGGRQRESEGGRDKWRD